MIAGAAKHSSLPPSPKIKHCWFLRFAFQWVHVVAAEPVTTPKLSHKSCHNVPREQGQNRVGLVHIAHWHRYAAKQRATATHANNLPSPPQFDVLVRAKR